MKKTTLVLCISFFIIFVTFCFLINNTNFVNKFDLPILAFFSSHRTNFFNWFFVITTKFGSLFLVVALCILVLILPNRKKIGIPLSVFTLASIIVNAIIKLFANRSRPSGYFLDNATLGLSFPSTSSFVSSHSMVAVGFYVILSLLLCKTFVKRKSVRVWLVATTSVLTLILPISRLYLGVHFPSDVFAGLALATSFILFFCFVYFFPQKSTHNNV